MRTNLENMTYISLVMKKVQIKQLNGYNARQRLLLHLLRH